MGRAANLPDRAIRRGIATYVLALLLIAVFSMVTNYLIDSTLLRQEETARVVNVSGRQRMNSQRIALLSTQLASGTDGGPSSATRAMLEQAIAAMRASHQALTRGSPSLRLGRPSAAMQRYYFGSDPGLDRQVEEFLRHATALASRPSAALSSLGGASEDADLAAIQSAARGPLIKALEDAVDLYQHEGDAAIATLHRWLIGVTLAFVLLTIAEGVFLYRPLFRHLGELLEATRTDPLTGALNRRAFGEEAVRLFARARRCRSAVAVLMVDIDHFKQINDRYGHEAGDGVIRGLVAALSRSVREMDLIARMGGEEFAILLPESGLAEAMPVARRIRAAVAAEPMRARGGALPLAITVSIGAAQLRPTDLNLHQALDRADEALYLAKRNGRDRVESEEDADAAALRQPPLQSPLQSQTADSANGAGGSSMLPSPPISERIGVKG